MVVIPDALRVCGRVFTVVLPVVSFSSFGCQAGFLLETFVRTYLGCLFWRGELRGMHLPRALSPFHAGPCVYVCVCVRTCIHFVSASVGRLARWSRECALAPYASISLPAGATARRKDTPPPPSLVRRATSVPLFAACVKRFMWPRRVYLLAYLGAIFSAQPACQPFRIGTQVCEHTGGNHKAACVCMAFLCQDRRLCKE